MSTGAWDDDEHDGYRPLPKVDIGQNVHVFRPVVGGARNRKLAWAVAAVPLAVAFAGLSYLVFKFPVSGGYFGMQPNAAFIMMCGFLVSFLIALPGILKLRREQASQELRIGDLGMEIVQSIVPSQPPMTTWSILWQDVASMKLRYLGVQNMYIGLVVTSKSGQTQFLRPADWVSAEGQPPVFPDVGSALISDAKSGKRRTLEQSALVRVLQQRGHKVDDYAPRPQDRLAAIIGLSLGIGAILAALIFSYFESR